MTLFVQNAAARDKSIVYLASDDRLNRSSVL